jgi:hypothetical protein
MDTLTIIICCSLAVLALAATLSDTLWFSLKSTAPQDTDGEKRISVILTVHDQAEALKRNLPAILSQDYTPGYEVIVVDESSTDDTEDVLSLLAHKYPNLYTTFIPESSHYLSRRKLALTLGAKAAKNEWLLFTDADCRPASPSWLATMAMRFGYSKDIVAGYTLYSASTPHFWQLERLVKQRRAMRQAQKGTLYCHNGHNLAVRKSVFFAHNGFLQNLKYLRGEYDFMANEYATQNNTAVVVEPEATIIEDTPSRNMWTNDQMFQMDTHRHLKRGLAFSAPLTLASATLHINIIAQICAIAIAVAYEWWWVAATAALCAIVTYTLRLLSAHKVIKETGEDMAVWSVPFMEIGMAWWRALLRIKCITANKYDFIRK